MHRTKRQWHEETVKPFLAKKPERKPSFKTTSGIEIERLYTEDDAKADYLKDLNFPGQYPFTRGIQPTMYRGRYWTMRQYAGFGSAQETNNRFHYLLDHGQTGLSVAFDLPTQMGLDSDDPRASGEVGRVGVAIDTLEDMETLFDKIPLDRVSTSMTINATASILLSLYILVAEKQGVERSLLKGTVQNDILKEYIARGTYIYPPQPSLRMTTDLFQYCQRHLPKWNVISVSGYHIREAGSTAVQEVAFTLANGIAYLEAACEAGLNVDDVAPQVSFFFAAHSHVIEEIAKFRAARRLWARIIKKHFKSENPRSAQLRFHTQTGGVTLTAQQPANNIVRVTLQALAAVLGGTQSLHTNSMDEALALPTEASARLALRTQQIIAKESGVAETIDPLAGAYAIESLTHEIESQAEDYINKIREMGGMPAAIEKGYIQEEIQESAFLFQKDVEGRKRIVVGVNDFVLEDEKMPETLKINPRLEQEQIKNLRAWKAGRNQKKTRASLGILGEKAKTGENLFPFILQALRDKATLGEVSGTLLKVFGKYRERAIL
ncbi:MAG: methylmalonyl-CoA mutase [Deltaproteobacteria bacterium RIFCSPLOWO2_02_FULL_50_16]|nr:MAG: methylmalonyl-CoA mutase [Deltaproteobacteria bacterium RIFCSPLOWO2_02_FULL_50_16]